jgi:hypothetical protein
MNTHTENLIHGLKPVMNALKFGDGRPENEKFQPDSWPFGIRDFFEYDAEEETPVELVIGTSPEEEEFTDDIDIRILSDENIATGMESGCIRINMRVCPEDEELDGDIFFDKVAEARQTLDMLAETGDVRPIIVPILIQRRAYNYLVLRSLYDYYFTTIRTAHDSVLRPAFRRFQDWGVFLDDIEGRKKEA